MKKFLLIALLILVAGLGGILFFSRKTTTTAPEVSSQNGSPFGAAEDINIPAAQDTVAPAGETTSFDEEKPEESVFRLANMPVAGFAVFSRGSDEIVRYVDRATGHISDATLPRTGAVERVKVTNQTLPKIYEAVFRPDGNAVLLRSLVSDTDSVDNLSLALTAPKSSSTGALYGVTATSLRGLMESVTTLGNNLLYVLKDNSSIATSNFAGQSAKNLFASEFNEWRLGRMGNNILVYPKASAAAPGVAYSLPAGGGNLTKLAGPLNGLTAVASANGTKLLYSYVEGGSVKLFTKNLSSGAIAEILPATLAEKCVWSAKELNRFFCGTPVTPLGGNEPDNWYLGLTHTTDYLWSFDTNAETALLMSEPKTEFNVDLDIFRPALSPQEDYFVFMNKRDGTLWAIKLK